MVRWLLVGVMMVTSSAALAAVTVLGGGIAKSCYEAAFHQTNPSQGLKTCNLALSTEALNTRDRAATFTNRGILRLRLADHGGALSDFDRAVGLKPDLGQTYINRAAALVQLGRLEEAVADASKALDLTTEDTHAAYFNRAMAYERLGKLEAAYYDLKAALEAKPDFAAAQAELSRFTVTRVDG